MSALLIYGSYGYTGQLLCQEALARGHSPILAGRSAEKLERQAAETGLESRQFSLDDETIASHLEDVEVVCHCAGPFVETAEPMVEACLDSGTQYLDITGEIDVFARLQQLDDRAKSAGITLLPGVGFDVVPTDCLAAFLHDRLPEATELSLAIRADMSISRGTALTALEGLGESGVVRRDGVLYRVPVAHNRRQIDFGDGPQSAVTIPFGDLVTAAHSTGIETVETYLAVPAAMAPAMAASNALRPVFRLPPVTDTLEWLVRAFADGPDERELATSRATVWGAVTDGERIEQARIRTPNPYRLTADAALSAAEGVLEGGVEHGFQTPSTAFGPDFVLECAETERKLC